MNMKRILCLLACAALALGLSGCVIVTDGNGGTPGSPFDTAPEVTLSQAFGGDAAAPTAVTSGAVQAGEPDYYVVNVAGSVSDELLFFEAEGGRLRLVLYEQKDTPALASVDPDYFGAASGVTLAAAGAAAVLAPSAITSTTKCLGPCVAVRRQQTKSTYYLKVETDVSSPVSYELFLYALDFREDAEPTNDTPSQAVPLAPNTAYTGAIETVDDPDYLVPTATTNQAELKFFGESDAMSFTAVVTYAGGVRRISVDAADDTATTGVLPGAIQEVLVLNDDNEAAPTAAARYTLTLN